MAAVDAALAERVDPVGGAVGRRKPKPPSTRWSTSTTPARCAAAAPPPAVDGAVRLPVDEAGFTTMWARLYAPDAAVIEQSVEQLARSVCDADPRTADERRARRARPGVTDTDFACECGRTRL